MSVNQCENLVAGSLEEKKTEHRHAGSERRTQLQ